MPFPFEGKGDKIGPIGRMGRMGLMEEADLVERGRAKASFPGVLPVLSLEGGIETIQFLA